MFFHISGPHSVFYGTEGASFAFRLYYVHPPYNWISQQLKIEPTWLISSIQPDTNSSLALLSFLLLFRLFFSLFCFEFCLRVHGAVIEIAIIIM
jgi:hypothetical protein